MKNFEFLKKGRKIIFSLALFVFVFAVACVVKIQAGTEHSGEGWLWGGSEEISDGNPNNGLSGYETGLGWISMNRTDCDTNNNGVMDALDSGPSGCPIIGTNIADYGVNIPLNGNVTGNAWSENIGWIQFDPVDPYPSINCNPNPCPSTGVVRNGDNLTGWARILSISQAGTNAGGWEGWIKMSGIAQNGVAYGVDVTKMLGVGSRSHTYAWSNELGVVDFGQAKIAVTYSLSLYPSPLDIRSNPTTLYAKITDSSGNLVSGKGVSFSKTGSSKVNLPSTPSCTTDVNGECSINLTASNFSTNETAIVTGNCTGGISCSAQSTVNIIRIPTCTLSCPGEETLSPGQTKSVKSEIDISGDAECTSSLITCTESGTDSKGNISVSGSCDVSETGNLRYGSSELKASAGSGSCITPINIKGPGWIETTP